MKNRCRLRMATGIALFSFYPTNMRHHSTCAIELHLLRVTDRQWEPRFLDRYIILWWLSDMRWRLIVRDISVSVTLHLDIIIIFHIPSTHVLQLNDNIRWRWWLTGEYYSHFSQCTFVSLYVWFLMHYLDRSFLNAVLLKYFYGPIIIRKTYSIVIQLQYALTDTTENVIETSDVVYPSQYLRFVIFETSIFRFWWAGR